MANQSFVTELRRRHVLRVVVAYAGTAWLLLPAAGVVLPAFGAPHPAALQAGTASVVSSATTPTPASAIPAKSLAVLPFANDSGDPRQQYFSDGFSESLILTLSQYPELRVIASESSFQLRDTKLDSAQIGEKLHAAHLLEGSVAREDGELRIRAELVDAADGSTLWHDSYDQPYKNLFALRDDITRTVAAALKAKLPASARPGAVVQTDRPPSGSLAAYDAYLHGNFYVNQTTEAGFRKAIAAFRQAIAADPKYALAYGGLSYAWPTLGDFYLRGPAMTQAFANARSASDTALELDPDSSAVYGARGQLFRLTFDWQGAAAAFQRSLTLDPANNDAMSALALSLASIGRLEEAGRLMREALAADPLDIHAYIYLSLWLAGTGKLEAAAQTIERAVALEPAAAEFHAWLAAMAVLRGHPDAALAAAQAEPDPTWRPWALALAYQAAGEKARADRALHELIATQADTAAEQIAEVYAYRGEPDQAFAWLDRAWRQRDGGVGSLLYDPFLLRYKSDPRFAAFCRKVGLPAPSELERTTSPNQKSTTS